MNMSNTDPNHILRNALIEGLWAFTTFFVGSGIAGFRTDHWAWIYGAAGAFLFGFIGYLAKSYGLGKKNERNISDGGG